MNTFDVRGRAALITGANRGIGKALVTSILEAGASKVYAAVRRPDSVSELVRQSDGRVIPVALDLTDDRSVRTAAEMTPDVELVVNNAGVLRTAGPFDPHTFDALSFELDVNVYGLLRVARAYAPVLKMNGGGAFVQINSISSLKASGRRMTYCVSKAASYSVTQSLRQMFTEQGTRVYSIHPGPIATDMAKDVGSLDVAEPPARVGTALLEAFRTGDFHVYPDAIAREYGKAYESFAEWMIRMDA